MKTKLIILIVLSLLFLSCEDTSELKSGAQTTTVWDNYKPTFLDGLYVTDRGDSEKGTIIFMSDRVIFNTINHKHEFKYSENMNALGYCDDEISNWHIRVNDISYEFDISSKSKTILFYFKRDSDPKITRVGVYTKQIEEPINEM